MASLQEDGKRLAMLKALKEHHEHMAAMLGNELNELGYKIYQACVKGEVITKSIRIDGSRDFTDGQDRIVSPEIKYRPDVKQEAMLFQFLRDGNEGSLIKETLHFKTLETWAKNRVIKNMPLPDESILKVWRQETAKVTRAPKGVKTATAPNGAEGEGTDE